MNLQLLGRARTIFTFFVSAGLLSVLLAMLNLHAALNAEARSIMGVSGISSAAVAGKGIPLALQTGSLNIVNALPSFSINHSPQIEALEQHTLTEDVLLAFTVTAKDMDGDKLSLIAKMAGGQTLDAIGATFTDHGNGTGLFAWQPGRDFVKGNEKDRFVQVNIEASDGKLSTNALLAMTVFNMGPPNLTGKVQSQDGIPIANVRMILSGYTRSAQKIRMTVFTDDNGAYTFYNLPSGAYKLKARRKGYRFPPMHIVWPVEAPPDLVPWYLGSTLPGVDGKLAIQGQLTLYQDLG